jgi:hypothetical protein
MSEFLKPNVEPTASVKPLINIGCLFDVSTGSYEFGKYGECILNGGLGILTGIVGIGNNYKTTITHYQSLAALSRIITSTYSSLSTYDTEMNIHEGRLVHLSHAFPEFKERNLIEEGVWVATDSSIYHGNQWYEKLKVFVKGKIEHAKEITVEYPFLDRDRKTNLVGLVPTFGEVDSLTEWTSEDVIKMQESNEIGDSGANTLHMRLGLAKTRMLMELPNRTVPAFHYLVMTGQLGREVAMQTGPIPVPPNKKLSYLKNGDKVKGVGDKFFFAMSNVWHAYNMSPLINQGTKGEEYPIDRADDRKGSTDLNSVYLRQLRSKSGRTGIVLELIVSQNEGVLPTLTEFHYIKNMNRFGLGGSNINFHIDLYPEVNLTRPTIRSKIDEDPLLCRAINITSELCQIIELRPNVDKKPIERELLCTPKELYEDLKSLGYDWNTLLQTRGWWTVNNDRHPIPYLSTLDLLRMRKNLYRPYWLS